MNDTYDEISSLHWRYPLARHLRWCEWWAELVERCDGSRASAARMEAVKAALLREMQAEHCPGMSVAYLAGVVRGRWAGE